MVINNGRHIVTGANISYDLLRYMARSFGSVANERNRDYWRCIVNLTAIARQGFNNGKSFLYYMPYCFAGMLVLTGLIVSRI